MTGNRELRRSITEPGEPLESTGGGTAQWGTLAGWIWFVLALLAVLSALMVGHFMAALCYVLSGLAVLPPFWASRAKFVPGYVRGISSLALFVLGALLTPQTNRPAPSAPPVQASAQEQAVAVDPVADALGALRAKLPFEPVLITRADYPKMYTKLGKAKFDTANGLMAWAALAAAESEQCPKVKDIGVSDSSTRTAVRWYVDCENGERFMVTEELAIAARDQYDPAATLAARAKAKQVAVAEPKSARWKKFNEANAATACDLLTQQAMLVPRSFSTGWNRWQIEKNDETGIVTIERDFKSENAYSMKINGRYRCVLNGDEGTVKGLSIREPTGWRKLM